MPSSLGSELEELRRWRLRPECSHLRVFEQLTRSEFAAPDEQDARLGNLLSAQLQIAGRNVPFYQELFKRLALSPGDVEQIEDLAALPVLSREIVQENFQALHAVSLPPGEQRGAYTHTSGSTGQPVRVLHSRGSSAMFTFLKHRQLRWFRFDPMAIFAEIRPAKDLPMRPDDEPYARGETCRLPRWRHVGRCFHTGPFLGYIGLNPLEDQVAWLEQHQPAYLLALSAGLEHLALGLQGSSAPESLQGLMGIAQTMTPGMRRTIETNFAAPVHESYGLNEIGIVAARCPEGGRFHVHVEHCLVEIVDEQGLPVAPGEVGHLLVTSLSNRAMPLIRYDTGDLAEAATGPCPCGRTLPAFSGLRGRYSRIAFLPPGTPARWAALEQAIEDLPGLMAVLRQYQVHQSKDRNSCLRIVAVDTIGKQFKQILQDAWNGADDGHAMTLDIVQVSEIPRGHNEKFERFSSDFQPRPADR